MQKKGHINPEGWKCPKTFEEYLTQFPDWHKQWLNKRYREYTHEDFEDVAQHLLLRTLETKRVEKYAPTPDLESRPGLFLHYMGMCFGRDLLRIFAARSTVKRKIDKLSDSLEVYKTSHQTLPGQAVSENEWLALASQVYAKRTEQEGDRVFNAAWLSEFRRFVRKHRPDLIPVLDTLESGAYETSRQNWYNHKHKITELAQHFERGTVPSNSVYRKRKNEAQKRYYRRHRERLLAWFKEHYAEKGPKFR